MRFGDVKNGSKVELKNKNKEVKGRVIKSFNNALIIVIDDEKENN